MCEIPADAIRSDDGHWWWDGANWQPVADSDQGSGVAVLDEVTIEGVARRFEIVTVWFKAFIPDESVSAPSVGCFKGDGRGFSEDPGASARITSRVSVVNLGSDQCALADEQHSSGLTSRIDCDTKETIETGHAEVGHCHFFNFEVGSTRADGEAGVVDNPSARTASVSFSSAAHDPLVAGAPDLDMGGDIRIDPIGGTLIFDGLVDNFPAYEGYASVDGGAAVPIFQISNTGMGLLDLVGEATQPVHVTVQLA